MKDYYSVLDVSHSASDEEIKSSYRKLAKKYHPDRGGDTEKFQEIQEAYSILGNPKKRQYYDNPKTSGVHYGDFGDFNNMDPQDIFDMFGVHVHRHGNARKPSSITVSLWVTLEDIANRNKKIVSVNNGRHNEHVEIEIPPAIDDNSSVRYPKLIKGNRDLIVNFKISQDKLWERFGLNLIIENSVCIWDLILGTTTIVETIVGSKIKLTIPAGTQPNTTMRISKHGLRDRNNKVGDMFVRINAYIPEDIPDSLKQTIHNHQNKYN